MRHKKPSRKFGRNATHRKAMFKNMATQLLQYEKIITTTEKAKELRKYVEPCITRAKEDNLHNYRLLLKKLHGERIVYKLIHDIAPRYADRPGGYTRIIHLPRPRKGDNARMSLIELVE